MNFNCCPQFLIFPFSAQTMLAVQQERHPACKSWVFVYWRRRLDCSFERLIVPVVTIKFKRKVYHIPLRQYRRVLIPLSKALGGEPHL